METLRTMLLSDFVDLFLSGFLALVFPLPPLATLVTIVLCTGHVERRCMFAASVVVVVVVVEEDG